MSGEASRNGSGAKLPGEITLSGPFVSKHRREILDLVRTTECLSNLTDPELRIERILEEPDRLVIETARSHLAERIGERLCAVCGGSVSKLPYTSGDTVVRFSWSRSTETRR